MGDFNAETNEASISEFCEIYNTKNIIKDKTCLKNPEDPAYVDLMLTNRPRSFQNSIVIETGLYDFDKMTVSGANWLLQAKTICNNLQKVYKFF